MADRLIVPSPEHIAARAEIEHYLRQPTIAAIVTKMADTFTDLLRSELSVDEFREMQVRNTAETSRGVCHSHDFLDANALMEIAFIETTGRDNDCGNEADAAIWSAAWEEAFQRYLTAQPTRSADAHIERVKEPKPDRIDYGEGQV